MVDKKDDLDFDFSDMDGKDKKSEPGKEPLRVVKPHKGWDPKKKEKKTSDDPIICIPVVQGWIERTISDCSAEEFSTWFQHIYPGAQCSERDFSTRASRMNAFKHVLKENIVLKFNDLEHARTKN